MTIFFSPSLEPIKFRYEEDVKRAAYERKTYFLSWINGGREKKKKKTQKFPTRFKILAREWKRP